MKRTLSLLTLCAIAAVAHAQQTTDPVEVRTFRTLTPAQNGKLRALAPGQSRSFSTTGPLAAMQAAPRPAWLEKDIDLNFRNEKPAEAIKIILKAAGKTLETVEIEKDLPTPQISLSIKKVKVGDALAAVGRLANAMAYIIDKDDKVTVHLRTRTNNMVMPKIITEFNRVPADLQGPIRDAIGTAQTSINTARPLIEAYTLASQLPDKRVNLDVRNTDAREVLKTLLKQADVDYILEEDVPGDKKYSFTFENVPLRMALDVVCQSIGVGWGAQKTADSKKVTVRVGKKWARRSTGNSNLFGYGFDHDSFNTHYAFPSYPDAFVNMYDFTVPAPAPITVNGIVREIEVQEIER